MPCFSIIIISLKIWVLHDWFESYKIHLAKQSVQKFNSCKINLSYSPKVEFIWSKIQQNRNIITMFYPIWLI